jgi:hypothetical protein
MLTAASLRWRPPRYIRERTAIEHERVRQKHHILVEGEDIPPPIEHFTVGKFQAIFIIFNDVQLYPGYEDSKIPRRTFQVQAHSQTHTNSDPGNTGCVSLLSILYVNHVNGLSVVIC